MSQIQMTEQKVIEMSKKQMSISEKQISKEPNYKSINSPLNLKKQDPKIRSLNNLNMIKGVKNKNNFFNNSIGKKSKKN